MNFEAQKPANHGATYSKYQSWPVGCSESFRRKFEWEYHDENHRRKKGARTNPSSL